MSTKQTKILDLDKFGVESERSLTIGGKTHPVLEMSFENFVVTTKEAQRLESNEDTTPAEHLEASIAMIQRSIPSVSIETLRSLGLSKIGVIVQFLNGELDAQLEQAASDETEAVKK